MTSIIILSYNTKAYTQMCIQSIRKFTPPGTYEIIIVDNASTDGSLPWLLAQPDIRLIANEKNAGFPKGCNQGLRIAAGDDLLLLNSDTIVTPRWLEQLLTALHSAQDIGAVSCMTNNSTFQHKLDTTYTSIPEAIQFSENYNHSDPSRWCKAYELKGFCFLFRRKVYEQVGLLDEMFTPGNYEDDDYSLRIRMAGWKLLVCKDTFIHHFGGVSFFRKETSDAMRAEKLREYNALLDRNRHYFLKKWNLSDRCGVISGLVQNIGFPKKNPNILLLDSCAGPEAHILLERYPSARISLLMGTRGDVAAMAPDFPAMYCKDFEHEAAILLKGTYDYILCLNDFDNYHSPSDFLSSLSHHLAPGGCILYTASNRIYSYSPSRQE